MTGDSRLGVSLREWRSLGERRFRSVVRGVGGGGPCLVYEALDEYGDGDGEGHGANHHADHPFEEVGFQVGNFWGDVADFWTATMSALVARCS